MPGFKDRMKAIKEHFKPPKRTKPDPKGCLEATGEHIKPPTQTKPESKGCFKTIKECIKRPTWMKPDPKGFVRAAVKPFLSMLPCLKRQKNEDDCPDLPEVKISYIDEDIPESLASRSCISLTDSESDGCPAEADLGPRSDSLEGIPEMLEAESLPSLMEEKEAAGKGKDEENDLGSHDPYPAQAEPNPGPASDSLEGFPEMLMAESLPSVMEEKEAAGKGKDEEKDLGSHDPCPAQAEPNPGPASDSSPQPQVTHAEDTIPETLVLESLSSLMDSNAGPCPPEADPGPRADRVPEPQERTSDEQPTGQDFHGNPSNPPLSKETLHLQCKMFPELSKEEKWKFADTVASKHLFLILEHFLKTEETACDELMYEVLASPKCSRNICLDEFIRELNASQIQDSKELPLAKVKALKGIRTIVKDHSNIQSLKEWLQYHLVTLSNVLVSQFQPKEQGSNGKAKTYLVPGEAIDILAILLQRLDLVHSMKSSMHHI